MCLVGVFSHGYYVMSAWAEEGYKVTEYYAPEFERTIVWNDPNLKITWPILGDSDPILSENDLQAQESQKSIYMSEI